MVIIETKHTTLRLSPPVRHKLDDLAELDGISRAQVINNLIIAEHRARRDEIADKRKLMKNEENLRTNEITQK